MRARKKVEKILDLGGKPLEITCPVNGSDDKLFTRIINQGIDAHLEAFTESTFKVEDNRRVMLFAKSEIPLLLRRLREVGTEAADSWADDISEVPNGDY